MVPRLECMTNAQKQDRGAKNCFVVGGGGGVEFAELMGKTTRMGVWFPAFGRIVKGQERCGGTGGTGEYFERMVNRLPRASGTPILYI